MKTVDDLNAELQTVADEAERNGLREAAELIRSLAACLPTPGYCNVMGLDNRTKFSVYGGSAPRVTWSVHNLTSWPPL